MAGRRADGWFPWALAVQVCALGLVSVVSPNQYAWMLEEPGQALPADSDSLLKAVLLLAGLVLPSLLVAWLAVRSRRRWMRVCGALAVLVSVLLAAGRWAQWVMEGQLA